MKEKIFFPDKPINRVVTTKNFNIHQDYCTPIPGFFIISSEGSVKSFADFSEDEADEFMRLLCTLRQGMKEKLGIKTVMIFHNEGTEWDDFHVWVFPRYDWMDKFGRGSASLKQIKENAKSSMNNAETLKQIRYALDTMKAYFREHPVE